MAIDQLLLKSERPPSRLGAVRQPARSEPSADQQLSDDLRRLAGATMTPGIVDGLTIQGDGGGSTSGQSSYLTADPAAILTVGPASHMVTVEPGTALAADGELIHLKKEVSVDLEPVLSATSDSTGHLYVCRADSTERSSDHGLELIDTVHDGGHRNGSGIAGPTVCLHIPGQPLPRRAVPIASVKGRSSAGMVVLSPISAWLAAGSVLVGSRTGTGLVITEDTIVANRTLHLLGGVGSPSRQGQVVVGPRGGENLVLHGTDIMAGSNGGPAELHLQRDGGELRIGGPLRGPDREPLSVTGGSDLSLGGGGVLMLGHQDGPNLILDENEIMAREGGQRAPLLLQWEGGETRFGGPLRGPADGPLNIASSQDLSLGGHGALMIGPKEAAHLVVDENEIMANTGADAANLYMQWQGGETHFGGAVCGPDDRPLTVSGEQQATLQADSGSLMVGQLGGPNLIFDDHQVMARSGGQPTTLGLQLTGGPTRLGGPLELAGCHGTEGRSPGWELRVETLDRPAPSEARAGCGDLLFSHDGEVVAWLDRSDGTMFRRSDHRPVSTAEPIEGAAALIAKLEPTRFGHHGEPNRITLGLDAERVREVAPELVGQRNGVLGLSPTDLAVLAIAALKEQQLTIDRLERTVAALSTDDG